LWRRRLLVVASMLVTAAAAFGYVDLRSPTWSASATVELQTQAATGNAGVQGAPTPAGLQDPLGVLASSQVAAQAAKLAGAADAASVQNHVTGTLDTTGGVLTIAASDSTPKLAQQEANAYAEAFVQEVRSSIQGAVGNLQTQINTLVAKIAGLERTSGLTSPEVTAAQAELANLYGQQTTLQVELTSYAVLQQKATLPTTPSGLAKKKVVGLALAIGLLAGCGIAFVREQLDVSLRSTTGVKELTDAPVLAELPFDREFSLDNGTLAVLDLPGSALAESIRELRTSLEVILEDKPCPVVMVTSSSPEDGKTFVTANLAASWAISGKRVVVVSGDLRRPRIEHALLVDAGSPGVKDLAALDRREEYAAATTPATGAPGVPGTFVDLPDGGDPTPPAKGSSRWVFPQMRSRPLASQQDVVAALKPTRVVGLSLLPSGGVATNSSELLNSPGMKAVMERLSSYADVVLVDSPPLMAVADAAILSRHVDGVVVVAVDGETSSPVLQRALQRLGATRAPVLGIVLNRVRGTTSSTYHGYYVQKPSEL
jgi:Mrp family chromosome partitioning ATPase